MLILQKSCAYLFCTYSTTQFRLAIFQMLNSYMYLVATILCSVIVDNKQLNKSVIYNKYTYK